jgi:hypothetical protein
VPAVAAAPSAGTCLWNIHLDLAPGLTLSGGQGTIRSSGERLRWWGSRTARWRWSSPGGSSPGSCR